jgi:hypothetical protein
MKASFVGGVVGVVLVLPGASQAAEILIINGTGSSTLAGPLASAGFTVIQEAYGPGAIASHLAGPNDISQIWIWNDGTFGNTFSPADPSRAFNDDDQAALVAFNASHEHWIMDGLSWRGHGSASEQNLSKNQALQLEGIGGGIVLGADDASGAAIVQHVNQVAGWFNFDPWGGVYSTLPASQQTGGTFFTTPNPVDPTQVVGTTTYSEVPNGLQPNGLFLGTAVFGEGTALQGGWGPVPDLPDAVFNGVTYPSVNHLITTTIPGGSIDHPVPDGGSSLALMGMALAAAMMVTRARRLIALAA